MQKAKQNSTDQIQNTPGQPKLILISTEPRLTKITKNKLSRSKRATLQPTKNKSFLKQEKFEMNIELTPRPKVQQNNQTNQTNRSILKNSFSFLSIESLGQTNSTTIPNSLQNPQSMPTRKDNFGNEISTAKQHKISFDMISQVNFIESFKEYNLKPKKIEIKDEPIQNEEQKKCCVECAIF